MISLSPAKRVLIIVVIAVFALLLGCESRKDSSKGDGDDSFEDMDNDITESGDAREQQEIENLDDSDDGDDSVEILDRDIIEKEETETSEQKDYEIENSEVLKLGDQCRSSQDLTDSCSRMDFTFDPRYCPFKCDDITNTLQEASCVSFSSYACTYTYCEGGWRKQLKLSSNEPCNTDPLYQDITLPGYGCDNQGMCVVVDGDTDNDIENGKQPVVGDVCYSTPDALAYCSKMYPGWGDRYFYFFCDPVTDRYVEKCCVVFAPSPCQKHVCNENNIIGVTTFFNGEPCNPNAKAYNGESVDGYICDLTGVCVLTDGDTD